MKVQVISEFKGIFEVSKAFYEVFKECISTDETRYFLCAIYYNHNTNSFAATDGRRLVEHVTSSDLQQNESGYYELAKIGKKYKLLPKQLDGQFPIIKRITSVLDNGDYKPLSWARGINGTPDLYHTIKGNMRDDSGLISEIILINKTGVNIDFITKVLKHVDDFQVLTSEEDNLKPIFFKIDPNTLYMVQPMAR